LAPTAALVLLVLEVKQKFGRTFVLCDGGRVNHALPSDWEEHHMYFPSSPRDGRRIDATICGPTCMAWDFIARGEVPEDIGPGSFIVYDAAGAYHWSWQSSFSHSRASVAVVKEGATGQLSVKPLVKRQSTRGWLRSAGAQ
jgi:diaminopimelate decarboxylase